jgi:hypothetical protein
MLLAVSELIMQTRNQSDSATLEDGGWPEEK